MVRFMSWHIEVDGEACIASGMCVGLASEYFELQEHSRPLTPDIEPDEIVLDAADSCPALAITVTEEGRVIGPRP
jgi:ferredoxin